MLKQISILVLALFFIGGAQYLEAKSNPNQAEEVVVTNIDEFLQAIAPDTTIRIETDEYEPIVFTGNNASSGTKYYEFEPVYMGVQLVIKNVSNFTITGSERNWARFLSPYSYANVIQFLDCGDITLQYLNCGHDMEGYCTGGVLAFDNCHRVRIEKCDLWGCGIEGLTIYDSSDFVCTSTTIRDCSYSIMSVQRSKNLKFERCLFHDNREFDLMSFDYCDKVRFDSCVIWNNTCGGGYYSPYLVNAQRSDVRFNRCTIFNNVFEELSSDPEVKFLSCVIFDNQPQSYDY